MSSAGTKGEATFPDDLNGDVLRRLLDGGDDFSIPRDIDFSIVFPDETQAKAFADRFRASGYNAVIQWSNVKAERPWDVTIVKHMLPTHSGITQFEAELERAASLLDGENDGWGCFAQNAAALASRTKEGE